MLGLELGLHVDALLKKDALKQGVLVSQHETLVRCSPMGRIEVRQCLLLDTDGLLELLDVLRTSLPESSLSLAVPLFSLLSGCVDLGAPSVRSHQE